MIVCELHEYISVASMLQFELKTIDVECVKFSAEIVQFQLIRPHMHTCSEKIKSENENVQI